MLSPESSRSRKSKSSPKSSLQNAGGGGRLGKKLIVETVLDDHFGEQFVPVPLPTRPDPSQPISTEREAILARYRKTIQARDDQKRKQEEIRGQMRKFLNQRMKQIHAREAAGRSNTPSATFNTRESEPSIEREHDQRRNEQIFKHLTFDGQGNPLSINEPDLEKMAHNYINPRFKVTRKRPTSEIQAIEALKGAAALKRRNSNIQQHNTQPQQPKARQLNQRPMDASEIKMHSLLEKLTPKSDLRALLQVDDKNGGGRKMTMLQKTDINHGIEISKGVELKSQTGQLMKSGGKI